MLILITVYQKTILQGICCMTVAFQNVMLLVFEVFVKKKYNITDVFVDSVTVLKCTILTFSPPCFGDVERVCKPYTT